MIAVHRALLQLWSLDPDTDSAVDLRQPLMYIDRFRMRKPGKGNFYLAPHLDSGSITRWSDPAYRWVSECRGIWEAALHLMPSHRKFYCM